METIEIIDHLLEYIEKNQWVTFVELQREANKFMEADGDYELYIDGNIVFWQGMSKEFLDIMTSSDFLSRVERSPAEFLTYAIDGCFLRLPIAKTPPKKGYKKPHWLPICFNIRKAS